MLDQQTLEDAAKSIGLIPFSYTEGEGLRVAGVNGPELFNPDLDDSHALRLMVRLRFVVEYVAEWESALCDLDEPSFISEIRIAATKAAAQIYRNKHA